jgi:hypothetical protein
MLMRHEVRFLCRTLVYLGSCFCSTVCWLNISVMNTRSNVLASTNSQRSEGVICGFHFTFPLLGNSTKYVTTLLFSIRHLIQYPVKMHIINRSEILNKRILCLNKCNIQIIHQQLVNSSLQKN